MPKYYKTFYTALLLILLSTAIIMIIYTYTINTSLKIVQEDIKENNLNQLRQSINHVDYNVDQLSMLTITLEVNPKVKLLSSIDKMENYEQIKLRVELGDMLSLQRLSQGWNNQVSVYSHLINKWIGTTVSSSPPEMSQNSFLWNYDPIQGQFEIYRKDNDVTIRASFPRSNLEEIVESAKNENNNPFFLNLANSVILNKDTNTEVSDDLLLTLSPLLINREEGTEMLTIGNREYMVNFVRSETLDWYLVDYMPLVAALQPIAQTKRIFYAACIIFLFTSIVILLYLYRKVQIPITTMLEGVQSIKGGDYSYRIRRVSHNEFDILYKNFNDMVEEIEDLIERVYKEELISREAMIKKLQAQINPHFLYNCLFFINNMNRLGNDEAVESMTQNLAEYFRYSTRLEEPMTSLDKELGVVENYLTIQHLRMERLKFEINIPDSMRSIVVPKLLLQPLVENSVIHGIEKKQSEGLIRITGMVDKNQYRIVVEDNGNGMTEEEIQKLFEQMEQPLEDVTGYALWNIQQRMSMHFQTPAGMKINKSLLGGLRITLYWTHNNLEGGLSYVSSNDR